MLCTKVFVTYNVIICPFLPNIVMAIKKTLLRNSIFADAYYKINFIRLTCLNIWFQISKFSNFYFFFLLEGTKLKFLFNNKHYIIKTITK